MRWPERLGGSAAQTGSGDATERDRPGRNEARSGIVVQGVGPGGLLATLYFDSDNGLLVRLIRYSESVVGRTPTQIDYSDYREVAGIKMPFKWTVSWLDGKENFELSEVQPNATIDPAKFSKP